MGSTIDYVAYSVVDADRDNEPSRWRNVGVAFWNNEQDSLTVLLDALPVNGKLVLRKPRQRGEREAGQEG